MTLFTINIFFDALFPHFTLSIYLLSHLQKDNIFIFGPLFSQYIYRLLNTTGLVHITTDYPEFMVDYGIHDGIRQSFFYGRKSFEAGDPISTAHLIPVDDIPAYGWSLVSSSITPPDHRHAAVV